jgi:hypothetical protein
MSDTDKIHRLAETLQNRNTNEPRGCTMNTKEITYTNIPTGDLEFAADYLDEELNKLFCLAIVLRDQLEPKNPDDPTDEENLIAWNLARVLLDRLEGVEFSNAMRRLLRVKESGEVA